MIVAAMLLLAWSAAAACRDALLARRGQPTGPRRGPGAAWLAFPRSLLFSGGRELYSYWSQRMRDNLHQLGAMAGRERDITVLLGELGLQRYAATFEDEDFTDPALLLSMRHDLRQPSLEELGMCAQLAHATVRVGLRSSMLRCCAV